MYAIQHKPGKVLDITLSGQVTNGDYETILPTLQNELNGNDVDGVLWDMSQMDEIDPMAVFEELKFDITHRKSFERIAVVGDETWHKWAAKLFKPLTAADVRYFTRDQRTDAGEWVRKTN